MAKAVKTVAMVVGAVALIGTGIGAALGGTMVLALAGTSVAASTIAMVAGGIATVAGMFVKPPEVPGSQTERLRASVDPRAFRKTVLGSTAMPVDVRYAEWFGKDQERCGWIVALASHRIDGVDEIWFDDERAWSAAGGVASKFAGYFWVRAIRTQGSASTVSFGRWGSDHRLTGCAYAHLEFKVTGNSKKAESPFASGLPSRVTIIGRGAPLYDPRRDSTVPGGAGAMRAADEATWSYSADGGVIGENVALQILRVLIGGRINGKLATGCGVPLRRLDLQSFALAANLCDELVNRSAGGTEPRFRAAGVLSEGDDPEQLLTALCAACCGRLTDVGGKLGLAIAHNDLAEAASDDGLNTDDVVGPFNWNPDPGMEATPNTVRGRYTDPSSASLYQLLPYPDVTLPQGEAGEVLLPLDLGLVESPSQAQRIAKQALQRKQYQGTFTAPFDIRAWKYRVGQVAPFTFAPLSFERRLFRVIDQEPGSLDQCVMTLRMEHPQIYAWDRDDRAPVLAAEPIVYDSRNNPLILGIGEAAGTALWEGVSGEGRPEDGATVGAPVGTPVGDRYAEEITKAIDDARDAINTINDLNEGVLSDISDLIAIYGDTASAAASASAADQHRVNAKAAADNAELARQAAAGAYEGSVTKAGEAETYRNQASTFRNDAQGYASTASQQAGLAASAKEDAEQAASASNISAGVATAEAGAAGRSAQAADTSRQQASTFALNAKDFADAASTAFSNAESKSNDAGQYAQAASGHANTAQAKAGEATSSASAASGSAAVATDKASQAAASAVLSARFTAGGNQAPNTELPDGDTSGWGFVFGSGATVDNVGVNLPSADWHPVGENALSSHQTNRIGNPDVVTAIWHSAAVSADEGQFYQAYARIASHRADCDVVLIFMDAAGNWLRAQASPRGRAGGGRNPTGWIQLGVPSLQAPPGTVSYKMEIRKYDTEAGQTESWAWNWRRYMGLAREGQTTFNNYSPGNSRFAQESANARIRSASEVAAAAGNSAAQTRDDLTATASNLTGEINIAKSVAADARNRTAAALFQQTVGVNNGRAQMTMYALDENGNVRTGIDFVGNNFTFTGDVFIDGTLTPRKFNGPEMARDAHSVWTGSVSPGVGQSVQIPWSLTLPNIIGGKGRFIYEYFVTMTTNAGQQNVGTYQGRTFYTNYVADGGLIVRAFDAQGNEYRPRDGRSDFIRGSSDFTPTWTAVVHRGGTDTGIVNYGDYFQRDISATYTVTRVDLRVTWVAI